MTSPRSECEKGHGLPEGFGVELSQVPIFASGDCWLVLVSPLKEMPLGTECMVSCVYMYTHVHLC